MRAQELMEAHRFLDGELSDQEKERFEDLMERKPDLARYVNQIKDIDSSICSYETVEAPLVNIPSPVLSSITNFLTVSWRVPAVPAAAAALLLLALTIRVLIPTSTVIPDHQRANLRLVYFSKTAATVSVVGSFNGWEREIQLQPREDSGYWVTQVTVPPGEYSYAFMIDGKVRVADPTANSFLEDDYGSQNSVVRVGI